MTTAAEPRSAPEPAPPSAEVLKHHWQDEADAAYLYRVLADVEPDAGRRDVFARLAEVEERHLAIWEDLLTKAGAHPGAHTPSGATRLRAFFGRRFGPRLLLPMLLREEGREVKGYLDFHRETPRGTAVHDAALLLTRESADHAATLSGLSGGSAEPWHRTGSGGLLRNVVYGFNDGLTANFGLVAGVIGASSLQAHQTVIVAGVAGLIADALSMGSSGFLAAKSEQVYAHEIAMERDEIALMPELERDELALIYEAKGIDRAHAYELATQIMQDPARMLDEQVRKELKIGEPDMSPMREAWITGLATGIGAIIPVAPFFFFLEGATAAWVSLALAMLAHFGVGAARSVFTGRGIIRSGMDMFVVGLGVAIVGYYIGGWVGRLL